MLPATRGIINASPDFDPARSREVGGAGIGLSIVKSICTAHHGRVEVESDVGRGSCFRVRLPLAGHPLAAN